MLLSYSVSYVNVWWKVLFLRAKVDMDIRTPTSSFSYDLLVATFVMN